MKVSSNHIKDLSKEPEKTEVKNVIKHKKEHKVIKAKKDGVIKRKSKEEILKEKEEKNKERRNIYKKLNQKTKRGQPLMKNKIEHLFNKINNTYGREKEKS